MPVAFLLPSWFFPSLSRTRAENILKAEVSPSCLSKYIKYCSSERKFPANSIKTRRQVYLASHFHWLFLLELLQMLEFNFVCVTHLTNCFLFSHFVVTMRDFTGPKFVLITVHECYLSVYTGKGRRVCGQEF